MWSRKTLAQTLVSAKHPLVLAHSKQGVKLKTWAKMHRVWGLGWGFRFRVEVVGALFADCWSEMQAKRKNAIHLEKIAGLLYVLHSLLRRMLTSCMTLCTLHPGNSCYRGIFKSCMIFSINPKPYNPKTLLDPKTLKSLKL